MEALHDGVSASAAGTGIDCLLRHAAVVLAVEAVDHRRAVTVVAADVVEAVIAGHHGAAKMTAAAR